MRVSPGRSDPLLPGATPTSPRGSRLLTATGYCAAANSRGAKNRLRSWSLSAPLAHHFGLLMECAPAGRLSERFGDGHVQPSYSLPAANKLVWRSIGNAAAHRFLSGGKGGLHGWERVQQYQHVV